MNPPMGVRRGHAGGRAGQFLRSANGELTAQDLCGDVRMTPMSAWSRSQPAEVVTAVLMSGSLTELHRMCKCD